MNGVSTLRLPGAHPWHSLAPGCRAQSRQKETSSCPKIVGPKSHGFNDVSSQDWQLAQWKHSHFGEKAISGEGGSRPHGSWIPVAGPSWAEILHQLHHSRGGKRGPAGAGWPRCRREPQGTLEAGGDPQNPWVARLEWSNFGWFGDPPFYATPSLSCFNTWNPITLLYLNN